MPTVPVPSSGPGRAGDYEIYFSVGQRDGTPVYRLPYSGDDGHKRYLLGKITITE